MSPNSIHWSHTGFVGQNLYFILFFGLRPCTILGEKVPYKFWVNQDVPKSEVLCSSTCGPHWRAIAIRKVSHDARRIHFILFYLIYLNLLLFIYHLVFLGWGVWVRHNSKYVFCVYTEIIWGPFKKKLVQNVYFISSFCLAFYLSALSFAFNLLFITRMAWYNRK